MLKEEASLPSLPLGFFMLQSLNFQRYSPTPKAASGVTGVTNPAEAFLGDFGNAARCSNCLWQAYVPISEPKAG